MVASYRAKRARMKKLLAALALPDVDLPVLVIDGLCKELGVTLQVCSL
jgi:hypothetical protein